MLFLLHIIMMTSMVVIVFLINQKEWPFEDDEKRQKRHRMKN